jgi:hypothetical protein
MVHHDDVERVLGRNVDESVIIFLIGVKGTFLLFEIGFILVEFEGLLSEDELTGVVNEYFRPVLRQGVVSSQFLLVFLVLRGFTIFFGSVLSFGWGRCGSGFLMSFKR